MPITSPVERISGPSAGSTSGKRLNGSTASLTATCPPVDRAAAAGPRRAARRASRRASPGLATLASGTPVALATNGTVRLARGLASMTYTVVPTHGVLHVDQAAHVERVGDRRACSASITSTTHGGSVGGGIAQAESPRVHAGLLDVLHHAADQHLAGVRRGWRRRRPRWRPRGTGRSAPGARPTGRPRGRGCRSRRARPSPGRGGRGRGRSASPGRRARSSGARAPGSRSRSAIGERLLEVGRPCRRAAAGCRSSSHSAFHFSRSSARSIDAGDVPAISSGGQQAGQLQRRLAAERHDHLRRHAAGRRGLGGDHVEHVLAR